MAAYGIVIGILTVLLAYVHTGLAINCFVCNSHYESDCDKENPPDIMKKSCGEYTLGKNYTMCRKIVQHIDFEVNGNPPETRVIRGCGWDASHYEGRCYQRSGFGGRQEVCSCSKEYCNDSVAVTASLTLTACTGLLLFLSRLLVF